MSNEHTATQVDKEIHVTMAQDAVLPWHKSAFFESAKAIFSVARWGLVALSVGFGYYAYNRDVNAQQTAGIADIQKEEVQIRVLMGERKTEWDTQFKDFKSSMVTKEQFDERTNAINQRLDRIEQLVEHISLKSETTVR